MVQGLDAVLKFIFDNVFLLVAVGFAVYFAYGFFKVRYKSKVLNRSDIERIKFIERMIPNKMFPKKFLYKGKINLGLITHFKKFTYLTKPKKRFIQKDGKKVKVMDQKEKKIIQLIVRPCIGFNIPNPLAKPKIYQLNANFVEQYPTKVYIKPHVYLDFYFGIYYDESIKEHVEIIKYDNLLRTDLNEIASIYFVKSQEQSTYDPIHAHALAMKERELQIELAKRRGKSETI